MSTEAIIQIAIGAAAIGVSVLIVVFRRELESLYPLRKRQRSEKHPAPDIIISSPPTWKERCEAWDRGDDPF